MRKEMIGLAFDWLKNHKKKLGFLALILTFIQFADGILPQLQILLLHGRMILPTPLGRIPLLLLLLLTFLAYGAEFPRMLLLPYILFASYLTLDWFYLLIFKGYYAHPIYGLATFNNYYSFFLFLPFAFSLAGTISTHTLYKTIGLVSIPIILLGIAQYLLNTPIIPIESIDKHFSEQSIFFYSHHIRAFSLFSSGLLFGTFCNLILAIATASLLRSHGRERVFSASLVLLAFSGSAASLTRSNLVQAFLVLVSVGVLRYASIRRPSKNIFLPFGILGLSMALILLAPIIHGVTKIWGKGSTHSDIGLTDYTSNDSLQIRYDHWRDLVLGHIKTPADAFLGSGLVQSYHSPFSTRQFIDNSYLATILNAGTIGLSLLMIILTSIWIYFYKRAQRSEDGFSTGMAAFTATWPFYGLINNAWYVYGIVALLGILTVSDNDPITPVKSGM